MEKLDNIEKIIKERIGQFEINWVAKPFPHAIIDNFLPSNIFSKIVESLSSIDSFEDIKKNFQSHVEYNKKVYGDNDLNEILKLPINILGGLSVKKIFEKYLNEERLISLSDWPGYGGYYPFHSMTSGGILGSHVDHSHSKDGELHVANSIYYVSPEWEELWGGETLFFNGIGLKIVKKITPLPNRLILFIHSSNSFHGVNTISSSARVERRTYYMDYYIKDKQLPQIDMTLKNKGYKNSVYSFHGTAFVPLFPLGIKSFKIKALFKKNTYPYFKVFLKYLIVRYLLNYRMARTIKKILN